MSRYMAIRLPLCEHDKLYIQYIAEVYIIHMYMAHSHFHPFLLDLCLARTVDAFYSLAIYFTYTHIKNVQSNHPCTCRYTFFSSEQFYCNNKDYIERFLMCTNTLEYVGCYGRLPSAFNIKFI